MCVCVCVCVCGIYQKQLQYFNNPLQDIFEKTVQPRNLRATSADFGKYCTKLEKNKHIYGWSGGGGSERPEKQWTKLNNGEIYMYTTCLSNEDKQQLSNSVNNRNTTNMVS